jgi:NAD/NADP transhydrogenase beta subunit
MLSHHTARREIYWLLSEMGFAIIATILFHKKDGEPIEIYTLILIAIVIGTIIGWLIAKKSG